jgi:hypothetical protein
MLSKVGLRCIVGMTPTCSLACSNVILIVCCFLEAIPVGRLVGVLPIGRLVCDVIT